MANLDIKSDMLFMAADGDGIGKKVGRAVIANDTDALHKISARIDAAQDFILHWAKQVDGVKISGGGDEFTAAVPKKAIGLIDALRKDIEHAFGYTISVGVGKSLSEAGTALLVAKLRGKNQIVHFSEEIKKDIKKAKRRVREKRASADEYKLAEAYLNKSEKESEEAKQYHVSFKDHKPEMHRSGGYAQYHLSKDHLHHILKDFDNKAHWEARSKMAGGKSKEGFHPTAIARSKAPAPIKDYMDKQKSDEPKKKILYHGVGKDKPGTEALKHGGKHDVHTYDPHHSDPKTRHLPDDKYDEVHSHYTLNVVHPHVGKQILQEIHDRLKPGGKAVVSVRRDLKPKMEKSEDSKPLEESVNSNDQDCQYCNETDGVDPDHCKYCHDEDAAEGEDNCPYCKGSQSSEDDCPYCQGDGDESSENCPYCQEDSTASQQDTKIQSPDSNNQQAPSGSDAEKQMYDQMGMNPPAQGKPEIGDNSSPSGLGESNPMYSTSGAPTQPADADPAEEQANDGVMPAEDATSKENLKAIAERIEGENVDGSPQDRGVAKEIDDTDIANAGCMQDSTSRPENYDANTPGDMGTDSIEQAQGNPDEGTEDDLASVLQEGLNEGADEDQLQNVKGMVGQALQGFKASKDVLEQAKEQSPQLYSASIMMLKAMIEMAKMLGMGQGQEDASGDEWSNPFPTHPDHGGERKPGHSSGDGGGDEGGTIGQPIGKLSAKHTTKHVARTPIPVGGVNPKGQKKVMDPKTGKIRFIDMKGGMVQSPTGVPIKSPKQGDDNEPKN